MKYMLLIHQGSTPTLAHSEPERRFLARRVAEL